MRVLFRTAVAVMALIASERALAAGAINKVQGPVYSPVHLAQTEVAGVRLGMTLKEAEAALTTLGFAPRFPPNPCQQEYGCDSDGNRIYFTQRFGESADLYYVGAYGPDAVVLRVIYSEPRSGDAAGAAAWRQAIVSRFGQPSAWDQFISQGRISDRMAYFATEDLRDDYIRATLDSCTGHNWTWKKMHEDIDCRPILKGHQQPALTVSFGASGVSYWLQDYGAIYRSMMRSKRFRDLDTRGYKEFIPGIE